MVQGQDPELRLRRVGSGPDSDYSGELTAYSIPEPQFPHCEQTPYHLASLSLQGGVVTVAMINNVLTVNHEQFPLFISIILIKLLFIENSPCALPH